MTYLQSCHKCQAIHDTKNDRTSSNVPQKPLTEYKDCKGKTHCTVIHDAKWMIESHVDDKAIAIDQ